MIVPVPHTLTPSSPRRHTVRRHALAALALASVLAGCGGSGDSIATEDTDPVGSEAPAAEGQGSTSTETALAPVDATDPSDPSDPSDSSDSTAAPTTAPTVEGLTFPAGSDWSEWLVVRRVTSDDGYWAWPDGFDLPVEARAYWARCDADAGACTAPQFDSRLLSDTESTGLPLVEAKLEGMYLTWGESLEVACMDPATNQTTGPLETTQTSGWTLDRMNDAGTVWQGIYETVLTNEASAACLAEQVGYRASMLLFDPTQVPLADDPVGVWWGENTASPGVERLVRACEPGEGCDAMLRVAVDDLGAATPARTLHDVPLSRGPDGVLYGSVAYVGACVSDADRSWVTDAGYDVTHEFWVTVYDLAGTDEERAVEMDERVVGTTMPGLTADQAGVCAPFERSDRMVGLSNETSALMQWTDEVGVAVPLPAG